MIVKSFLGIFFLIICVSLTKQAPQARLQNNNDRPRFSNHVENFLQTLNRNGVKDKDKIKYLGEILSALSYYKFNDPNFLEYCAGQKIVQDGYRDAQRQKNYNVEDGENISERTISSGSRRGSPDRRQGEIDSYNDQPTEDYYKRDAKENVRKTQERGIDGYQSSSRNENLDYDEKGDGASHEDEDSYENEDSEYSDSDGHSDDDDDQGDYKDHDDDTNDYSEGDEEEKLENQSIDGHNSDHVQHSGTEDDTHAPSDLHRQITGDVDKTGSQQGTTTQVTNRDRDNHYLNEFSTPRGSYDKDSYGRDSQNYYPYGRQSQENDRAHTKSDYGGRTQDSSNSRGSYDPYSNYKQSYDPSGERVAQRPIDEMDHSGDYDNIKLPTDDTSRQVNEYLNQIRLHDLPPNFAKYAEAYLNYAKNAIGSYANYAKNFNSIRPCLQPLVEYFNLLNDDLANAYKRCKDDCFYSRLDSYSTSITQYTATTNECIANAMH